MIRIRGFGPVYWGVERYPSDRAIWTRAWLVEDLPPYRRSTQGWRIRVGEYGLHFGLCMYSEDPHRRLDYDPGQIGRWGRETQEPRAGEDPQSLRPVGDGGCLHGAGEPDHGPPADVGRVPPSDRRRWAGQGAGRHGHQDVDGDGGVGGTS